MSKKKYVLLFVTALGFFFGCICAIFMGAGYATGKLRQWSLDKTMIYSQSHCTVQGFGLGKPAVIELSCENKPENQIVFIYDPTTIKEIIQNPDGVYCTEYASARAECTVIPSTPIATLPRAAFFS